jgi:hypothetical protein
MSTDSFTARVIDLTNQAATQAAAASMPGVVPRPWQIPSSFPSSVPIYDPIGFIVACDRTDLNAIADVAYNTGSGPNAGRIGTVAAAKMAIDHVAGQERALHARHASPVRLRSWAAVRRAGHASLPYGIFGAFAAVVNDAASAATAVDNAPSG